MSDTFSQLYIHIVFAVKGRRSLIHPSWEDDLFKYITGIVQRKEQKMLAINGMPDHIHILVGIKPTCCISDLVREIKKSSNEYIKEHKLTRPVFQWQKGYGAFSYNQSALDRVIRYIMNQKEHHKRKTFRKEYEMLLMKFHIEYKPEYLFEWIE